MKTMLISFQCCSLMKCFPTTASVLTIKMADCDEIEAGQAQKKGKGSETEPRHKGGRSLTHKINMHKHAREKTLQLNIRLQVFNKTITLLAITIIQ